MKESEFPKDWQEALAILVEGNDRFVKGLRSVEHFPTPSKLRDLADQGQRPYCIILSCADSRVPSELVFDQGLGDLIVLRVAGNVIAPSLLASMEFAASSFNTPLIVVLGHSRCGIIKATADQLRTQTPPASENIQRLINRIIPSVKPHLHQQDELCMLDLCSIENVHTTVRAIQEESEILRSRVQEKKLAILPAFFNLNTGQVEFNPTIEGHVTYLNSIKSS
jgi:carbonic anhydrase